MVIYKITNKLNGKSYVGLTKQPLAARLRAHFSNSKTHNNTYIKKAIQKYGKDAFTVSCLGEYCSLEQLNDAESYYIDFYNTLAPNGYNLQTGGNSHTVSDITRKKLSDSHKGLKYPNFIRTTPPWNKGTKGISTSGFKKGHIGYHSRPEQVVVCSNGVTYQSISIAARSLGTSSGKICAVLNGKRNHTKGFTFKRVAHVNY